MEDVQIEKTGISFKCIVGRSNLFGAGGGWVGAKVIIKLFLNFGGTFLAFIYNFTCEITKLL